MRNPLRVNGLQRLWDDNVSILCVLMAEGGVGEFGYVTFENGIVVPITRLTDAEGDDVDRWDVAFEFHFGDPACGYGSSLVSYLVLDKRKVH